jgi:hypothetical protein
MGAKGAKERASALKRAACRANARKPRGRWANTPEREVLEAAKSELRAALPDAAARLVDILRDPDTSPELFLQALRFAADRAGLPALSQLSAPAADYCGVKCLSKPLTQEYTRFASGEVEMAKGQRNGASAAGSGIPGAGASARRRKSHNITRE